MQIEADVSALLYRGFSPPAALSSCHPPCPDFNPTLASIFQACGKFSVKNDQQEEIKEKKKWQEGETSAWGGADSFELKIKLTRV